MKRILNRLMLLAFAALVSVSATGCPDDGEKTDPDLSAPKDGSATPDLTPKD